MVWQHGDGAPGNENEVIACRLERADLAATSSYKCLSYVWGSQDDRVPILLDGKDHGVTRNLHAALHMLRRTDDVARIWIDALCIDQDDDGEKREQVAMMGDIFRSAEEVIVWLGEPASRVSRGMDMHMILERCMTSLAENAHFHELPFGSHCMSRRCPAAHDQSSDATCAWAELLAVLRSWFESTWFERTWTVQEIVLPRKATLMLGSLKLPWSTVTKGFGNLREHMSSCCTECVYGLPGEDPRHVYRMTSNVIDFVAAKNKLDQGQHLIEPLLQFNWKKATDPRDKIYGLLGLQSGRRPTPVMPDYAASLQDIFTSLATDVIKTQDWLVPLCLDLRQELKGLPSWVPDWTLTATNPVFYSISRFTWTWSYSAADELEGNITIDGDNVLNVSGIRVDDFSEIGEAYEMMKDCADQLAVFQSWKTMTDLDNRGEDEYISGGTLEQAFWRTMFADRFHQDQKPRQLKADDVTALYSFLEETEDRLKKYGNDALICLNDATSSHIIAVLDRRLFRTRKGWLGVCPKMAAAGDEVHVLGDCPVPVVLRRVDAEDGEREEYRVLGHCYVHGIMEGEASELGIGVQRIRIV
ncbi:hypothetical protein LTR78_007684 [Recurvomyces mirabilis]|uniref:Heterokaryon incompatibility domain-containing protein n=1 Tax=Recurvomyces mirabilis TaxID=574656 RepID=A0AAE0WJ80_9PEZI|nr:hypothetical protein LTR78_007684 [Recurvomyces mirabilis]KAK5151571.1 hypothetical protein LTS14_009058 [Recurvomyces mirabilis]